MSAPLDWAFAELDARRAEDARFPAEPVRGTREWSAYARMKGERARRRKALRYSRKTAEGLVAHAARVDSV